MGKAEDEQALAVGISDDAQSTSHTAEADGWCCCCFCANNCNLKGLVKGRCVIALLFGAAVFLSALFWLPFFHDGNAKDLDLNTKFEGHDIVASFILEKPISFLEDYILLLEDEIFDEFSLSDTKVDIISLEPSAGSNITKVVFAVDSDVKNRRIPTAVKSLFRSPFEYLVLHKQYLSFSTSLFGESSSFEVLKFSGGFTVSPLQSAFLPQEVQIYFNFTLNFSMDQILSNFEALRTQLKSGLHLASYENLYISLTNSRGSTIDPPTIVQSRVLLAVGVNPSTSRRKQLAHTITDSHTKNLGLNNTVFGKVKQVRLSSLPHSSGGEGPSPAPTPLPQNHHHHHHHHRHHHHHHHHRHHHYRNANHAPAISPAPQTGKSGSMPGQVSSASAPVPAPTPWNSHEAAKPPSCHFGYRNRYPRKKREHSHLTPETRPVSAPHITPSSHQNKDPPAPSVHQSPASSPLPHVVFAHVRPPSKSEFDAEPPDLKTSVSPSPSPSSAGILSSNMLALLLFLLAVLCL